MSEAARQGKYERQLQSLNDKLSHPKKVNRNQDTIFTKEALTEIDLGLQQLRKSGALRFRHQLLKNEEMSRLDDTQTVRCVRRVIKLRFRCTNQKCPEFHGRAEEKQKSQEYRRHWTSYYGLVDFRFFFEKVPNKNSTLVNYSFYIYRQKCKVCKQWGRCGLIESCFNQLFKLYILLLKECLKKIKAQQEDRIQWRDKEKYGDRPAMRGAFNGHLTTLCEACEQRVCLRFYEEHVQEESSDFDGSSEDGSQTEDTSYIVGEDLRGRYR